MIYEPIINKCIGCEKVRAGPERGHPTCSAYFVPASKWHLGNCPLATHIQRFAEKKIAFEDPLKRSKRLAKEKGKK